jgi:VCBS repeat-containing protein
MAGNLTPPLRFQEFDSNGDPLSGGLLYSYAAGTTTPQATYTSSSLGTPNANPVVLDSAGRAAVWLDPSLSYKFVLKDSGGSTIYTEDNVIGLVTNDSVATASIQDGAVTTAKLADDSVTAAKLKDSAVVDADRAVTSDHIRDGAVVTAKLGAGSVSLAKLAAGAMGISSSGYISKTASFTAALAEDAYLVNATSGAVTVTLPAAASSTGKMFCIKKTDSSVNAVTVDANASETIDGTLTRQLAAQHDWLSILCDGSGWRIVNGNTTSEVHLTGGNGHGSTNTKIRRFATTIKSIGSAITYADSATNGGSFTINEDGVYSIHYFEYNSAVQAGFGVSLNSAQLTTSIFAITNADRIAKAMAPVANAGATSTARHLKAGDVIRAHTDAAGTYAPGDDVVGFSIVKVS